MELDTIFNVLEKNRIVDETAAQNQKDKSTVEKVDTKESEPETKSLIDANEESGEIKDATKSVEKPERSEQEVAKNKLRLDKFALLIK